MPYSFRSKRALRAPRLRAIRKRRSMRNKRLSKVIKDYVKKTIDSTTETKVATHMFQPTNFNGVPNVAGDIIQVLPVVDQGDNSYQRTGLETRLISHHVRGMVKWQPNTFAEDTVYCNIWLVEDKIQKNFSYTAVNTPSGTYPNDFFHCLLDNTNEPINPTGDWNEVGYRWNTKRFKIMKKTIRLTPNYASQSTSTPFVNVEGKGESMKIFKFDRYFGKKGRTLKYPNATSIYPQNYNTYMFVSFYGNNAAGGYTTLSNVQVSLAATSRLHFEDA